MKNNDRYFLSSFFTLRLLFLVLSACCILAFNVNRVAAQTGGFALPVFYNTGNKPYDITSEDFNHDGWADVATANADNNTISVFISNGNGTFQNAVHYAVGPTPTSIVSGDFNDDDNPDLAIAEFGHYNLRVLLGNGNGTFQNGITYSTSREPLVLTTTDLNHDDKLDLITGNYNQSGVDVLLGNGNGTFQSPMTFPAGGTESGIVAADLNQDGNQDIAVTCKFRTFGIVVLFGNGDGTLQPPVSYYANDNPEGITAADFTGDGFPELVVGNAGGGRNISVLVNNGNGTFQAPVSYSTITINNPDVVAGDFNLDGKLDIAAASPGQPTYITVFHGNGNGTFQTAVSIGISGNSESPWAIAKGDFNGDGKTDLATANRATWTMSALLNIATPPPPQTTIDPRGYTGIYYLDGNPAPITGSITRSLSPGSHTIQITDYTTPPAQFGFTVDGAGRVTSVSKPEAAEASGNTLNFRNATVNIDPQNYTGVWNIASHPGSYTGVRSFTLVPGMIYNMHNGLFTPGGSFAFTLGADGRISSIGKPDAASGVGGNTFLFRNATVLINPQAYTGLYKLSGYPGVNSGQKSFVLIPGLSYLVDNNYDVPGGSFVFDVDRCGFVTNVSRPGVAEGIGVMLRFKNSAVTIEPQNYTGIYRLTGQPGPHSGRKTFNLMPGLAYVLDNGLSINGSEIAFTLDNCGVISSVTNQNVAKANGTTLTLATSSIQFDAGGYTGNYRINYGPTYSSSANITLINSLKYVVDNGAQEFGVTSTANSVTPNSLTFNSGSISLSVTNHSPAPGSTYQTCPLDSQAPTNTICAVPQYPIVINPQAYNGTYYISAIGVSNSRRSYTGTQTLHLKPGNYQFDNALLTGNSYFTFSVSGAGQITDISNPTAAQAIGSMLLLNNTAININPQAYTGVFRVFSHGFFRSAAPTLTVIPGMTYGIDNGSSVVNANGTSLFYFDVAQSGAISNISVPAAARAENNTLIFNNTTLTIEPNNYTGRYNLSSYHGFQAKTGRASFVLIPGLLYSFDASEVLYESVFGLDQNGFVTSVSPGGFAIGLLKTLSLANVRVRIDPNGYNGSYFISAYNAHLPPPLLSGIQEMVLIPHSRFSVTVNGDTRHVTPTNTDVTPSTVNFNNGSQTFNFSIVEACPPPPPGLISWWRGEENALDSAGQNHGQILGNVQYSAGKNGRGFRFQDWGSEKVHINSRVYEMSGGTASLWFNWDGNQFVHGSNVMIGSSLGGVKRSPLFGVDSGYLLWEFGSLTRMGTNTQVLPGRWYHAVMTYDSNYNIKVYVNGVLVSGGTSVNPEEFRNSLAFGNWNDVGSTAGFGGVIDEVQIYNRPLSDCEVRNLYNSANGLPCEVCDNQAPTTGAVSNPGANAAGWNSENVTVSLTATDNVNGTGVREIVYRASGAQTVPPTTVGGSTATLTITAEGETTINYFARDNAGNVEAEKTLLVKIDKTAPSLSAEAAADGTAYMPGTWTKYDVTVSFHCTDSGSGVAQSTPPTIISSEGANQSSAGVCTDAAGNTANASFTQINIDKTPPVITIASPQAGGSYLLNQAATASYSCTDNGSGVADCVGTIGSGAPLPTNIVGVKSFTVSALDKAGNSAEPQNVTYRVVFGIVALYDQNRAHQSGSTIPIKIRLTDVAGLNLSSASMIVHAVSAVQVGSGASTVLEDPGNANPDFDFRYDQNLEGYIYNLQTKDFRTGTYQLNFIVGNSPSIYSVYFQIRQ